MKLGTEDIIHKNFSFLITQYEGYKLMPDVIWSYNASGELRAKQTAALLKAKGVRKGWGDYQFIKKSNGIGYILFLEFKKPKTEKSPIGKQSDFQKQFESFFGDVQNAHYEIAYSVEEGINILTKYKFLKA